MALSRGTISGALAGTSAAAAGMSGDRFMSAHCGIHGHYMPMIEPNLPDERPYLPVRADATASIVVLAGNMAVVAPLFGGKYGGVIVQDLIANVNPTPLNSFDCICADFPFAATGPWAATMTTPVANTLPFVGVNPFIKYGMADYTNGVAYDRPGLPMAQFCGGFIEMEIATSLAGAASIVTIDDSVQSIGRRGIMLTGTEVDPQYATGISPIKLRGYDTFASFSTLFSSFQPVIMTGLGHRKFIASLTSRATLNMNLGTRAETAAFRTAGNDGNYKLQLCPNGNPAFGLAQLGGGFIVQNNSADSLTIVVRAHYSCAITPSSNAAAPDGATASLLQEHAICGRVQPKSLQTQHELHDTHAISTVPGAEVYRTPGVAAPSITTVVATEGLPSAHQKDMDAPHKVLEWIECIGSGIYKCFNAAGHTAVGRALTHRAISMIDPAHVAEDEAPGRSQRVDPDAIEN